MFGLYGGRFVAETLMPLILEVERAYGEARADPAFAANLNTISNIMSGGRARSFTPSA